MRHIEEAYPGLNVIYSTPDAYVAAVKAEEPDLPVFEGDFMSYADDDSSYWTGFYTSRPTLKGMAR